MSCSYALRNATMSIDMLRSAVDNKAVQNIMQPIRLPGSASSLHVQDSPVSTLPSGKIDSLGVSLLSEGLLHSAAGLMESQKMNTFLLQANSVQVGLGRAEEEPADEALNNLTKAITDGADTQAALDVLLEAAARLNNNIESTSPPSKHSSFIGENPFDTSIWAEPPDITSASFFSLSMQQQLQPQQAFESAVGSFVNDAVIRDGLGSVSFRMASMGSLGLQQPSFNLAVGGGSSNRSSFSAGNFNPPTPSISLQTNTPTKQSGGNYTPSNLRQASFVNSPLPGVDLSPPNSGTQSPLADIIGESDTEFQEHLPAPDVSPLEGYAHLLNCNANSHYSSAMMEQQQMQMHAAQALQMAMAANYPHMLQHPAMAMGYPPSPPQGYMMGPCIHGGTPGAYVGILTPYLCGMPAPMMISHGYPAAAFVPAAVPSGVEHPPDFAALYSQHMPQMPGALAQEQVIAMQKLAQQKQREATQKMNEKRQCNPHPKNPLKRNSSNKQESSPASNGKQAVGINACRVSTNAANSRSPTVAANKRNAASKERRMATDPLLEDFKSNKSRAFTFADIRGHVMEFALDQHGSRFIQQNFEAASDDERQAALEDILPHILSLGVDVFGNYVVQKFLEHGGLEQRLKIADTMKGQVLMLSLHMYGCRVVQKALEVLPEDEQRFIVAEMEDNFMRCAQDQYGNHVVQKILECVPASMVRKQTDNILRDALKLSSHPYGCRVVKSALQHTHNKELRASAVEEVLQRINSMAVDQYGNYVIQLLLEHGNTAERMRVVTALSDQIVSMSMHKFASNVVEKALINCPSEERDLLINSMLASMTGSDARVESSEKDALHQMMKDQYGNYVVQRVLEVCNDQQRDLLLARMSTELPAMKEYTYGKHIVVRVEKLLGAKSEPEATRSEEVSPAGSSPISPNLVTKEAVCATAVCLSS